jgi:hypothetical protein
MLAPVASQSEFSRSYELPPPARGVSSWVMFEPFLTRHHNKSTGDPPLRM